MGKMDDLALNPVQTPSRNFNQAIRILSNCPDDLLENLDRDEGHWVLSPSVTEVIRDGDGYEANMPLAIAARVPRSKKRPTEKDALFLVMDDNVLDPVFSIQRYATVPLSAMAKADGEGLDAKDVDLILNRIEENIRRTDQNRRDEKQRLRKRRVKRAVNSLLGVVCITVAVGGSIYGYRWHQEQNKLAADRQKQENATADKAYWDKIAAYDVKNVMLQSPLLAPGSAGLARIDRFALSLLNETPPLQDLLDHPRKAVVLAGETKKLTDVPLGKGVRVITDAPEGNVMVDVTEDGSVWLAALPGGNNLLYNVIIQSQNLPK
jgi:hypothetical protein